MGVLSLPVLSPVLTRPPVGVLIECEPAIKSIIVHLDSANNDIIIEDLDEQHLVVKENMVHVLKQKLEDVSLVSRRCVFSLTGLKSAFGRHTDPRSPWQTATEALPLK